MKDKSNKTSRKGGRKFCPTQAPVYRQTEMLLAWAVPVVDSLPKSLAAQTMGRKIIEDIMESLDAISLALIAEKGEARLELINILDVRLTSVRTALRTLVGMKMGVSPKQQSQYIGMLANISGGVAKWRNANTCTNGQGCEV